MKVLHHIGTAVFKKKKLKIYEYEEERQVSLKKL